MTDEQQEKMFRAVYDRITDVFLRCEALRVSLEQSIPEFHQRFETSLEQIQARYRQSLETHLVKTIEDENRELMRLLLELHEGTEQ